MVKAAVLGTGTVCGPLLRPIVSHVSQNVTKLNSRKQLSNVDRVPEKWNFRGKNRDEHQLAC